MQWPPTRVVGQAEPPTPGDGRCTSTPSQRAVLVGGQHPQGHKKPPSASQSPRRSERAVWVGPAQTPLISMCARRACRGPGREERILTGAGPEKPPSLAPCPRQRVAGGRLGGKQGLQHCKPAERVSEAQLAPWGWQGCQHPLGTRSHHFARVLPAPPRPHTMMPPQRGLWKALVLTGAPSLSWMYRGEWERSGTYSRKFRTG